MYAVTHNHTHHAHQYTQIENGTSEGTVNPNPIKVTRASQHTSHTDNSACQAKSSIYTYI